VKRRDGQDRRSRLHVEARRLQKLSPQPRHELVGVQARGMGLENRADSTGDVERGQLRSVLDDFDLPRQFWRKGFQVPDSDFGLFERLAGIVRVTAAMWEPEEIARDVRCGDEVGEEVEVLDLESGGRCRVEVEERLTVAAVLWRWERLVSR
jgi:hypothetical protein